VILLVVAVLLAIFVLPSPWGVVTVAAAVLVKVFEVALWLRWSRRRPPVAIRDARDREP
jgi:hypothetical protein